MLYLFFCHVLKKNNYSFAQKCKYYFENTISAGPIGIIKWLSVFSIVIVLFLGLIILVFGISSDPESVEGLGFIEGSWKSLMATLDPGTMGGDEGWPFRIIRFLATLVGIFLISILIGIISSGIDEKIDELKKGKTQVLETNHTLILGWSEKIFSIISEIIEANENQKKPAIVVMSEMDKVEMEDEIRSHISNFKNTKLIVRSGNPLIPQEIAIVNPNQARSIVVLSPDKENADTYVIKTVLAFTNGQNRKKEAYNIVAEIKDINNFETAELVGGDEAVFVISGDLISRITAQTCRQSGLSVVYTELLQFDGDEIYFSDEKTLIGKTYKDAIFAYETSSIIGIFTSNQQALINPNMDTIINQGDQIIAISEDDDKVIVSKKSDFGINKSIFTTLDEEEFKIDKTLILGWNDGATTIVKELDQYAGANSLITVVNESEIDFDHSKLNNLTLTRIKGNTTNKKVLDDIQPETFDHIIVLSNPNIDIQESDAKTLICLLHLRNRSEKCDKNFSIVSEMKDLRNRELGVIAKADDFIVGDNIISLMMSQLSENKDLKKVFDVLFQADGSEIYLKPISRYIKTGEKTNFYSIVERASELGETAIGYRIFSQKDDSKNHFGVKVNPKKSDYISFDNQDFIIVLSED